MQKFKILDFIIKWDFSASPLVNLSRESGRIEAFVILTSTSLQGKHQNLTIITLEEMYWKAIGQSTVGLWVGGRLDVSEQVEGNRINRPSARIGDRLWPQSYVMETTSNMAAAHHSGQHWSYFPRTWGILRATTHFTIDSIVSHSLGL